MTEGFSVDIPQLRVHATVVGKLADQLGEVSGAAEHVARLDDAYGFIPNTFGWPDELVAAQTRVAALVSRCARQMREATHRLRQSVNAYEDNERSVADIMKKLDGGR